MTFPNPSIYSSLLLKIGLPVSTTISVLTIYLLVQKTFTRIRAYFYQFSYYFSIASITFIFFYLIFNLWHFIWTDIGQLEILLLGTTAVAVYLFFLQKLNKKAQGFFKLQSTQSQTIRSTTTLANHTVSKSTSKMAIHKAVKLNYDDVNAALRAFCTPNLLQHDKLLKLKQVKTIAVEKHISEIDALKKVITDSIEYFKPVHDNNKRTSARLKYEILKMIAHESATESQIMWELGFDVFTRSTQEKLSQDLNPRFKLEKASEYSATSIRSFKRLKKEAIEILRWRLQQGETLQLISQN